MRANPERRLTGDHNECPGCGQLFNSTAAFDKHRTGSYNPPERRCLTGQEMLAKGMAMSGAGWWVTESGGFSEGRWAARMPFAAPTVPQGDV